MPTFAPGYIKPGAYLEQVDISNPAVLPGIRIFAPIGQGAKTLARQDTLIKGVTNGVDGPLSNNIVIDIASIIDAESVIYTKGVDYQLTRPTAATAAVDWSLKASLVGVTDLNTLAPDPGTALNGQYLRLVVNGGPPPGQDQDILFSGAIATPQDVANFINAWGGGSLAGVASINGSGQLVLSANSVSINPGNAASTLGFQEWDSASVKEPAEGVSYNVVYTSDKTAAEYKPRVFTSINQIIAYAGEPRPRVTVSSGNATAAGSLSFTDNTKAWATDDFVGYYLKILSGTGKGQVRVIISNTANTLTLSQDWNNLSTPDVSSQYAITDVNDNSITMGSQVSYDTGSTVFMVSQYADDIFNDTNIKAAIDNLKEDTSGLRPYSLVLMRALGSDEAGPIAYLKAHCVEMSNVINNKWRQFEAGLAQGNDNYLDFIALGTGTNDDRAVILSNTSITRDFGFGTVQLGGDYFAAAHAGLICRNEEASIPLLNRSISAAFDVTQYSDPFSEVEKNLMAAAGITIYERRGVDLICRDALNTSTATILSQETKLTRSKDYVSQYIRGGLEVALVGQRFITSGSGRENVLVQAKSLMDFMIADLLARGTITRVENLAVKQNAQDPRQLDILADFYLTTDVKWVYILAGFGV